MVNKKNTFYRKKVLILGLGLNQGGVGSAKFFAEQGAKVRVTDLKSKAELKPSLDQLKNFPDIEYVLGQHRYEDLDWADLIIRNPAIKPDNPYLIYAQKKGKQVEMDMGIFLQYVNPNQIIGITGTKGKSTTASLIYEVLKQSGFDMRLAGNIGQSVFDTLPSVKENTLVVLELSSFQLEAFGKHQVSPKWAVITNIYEDHLNYYGSMEEYIKAKRYIAQFQTKDNFLFLRKDDKITNNPDFLKSLKGQVSYFSYQDLPENFRPKLPGEHNLTNFAAALSVLNIFQVDRNQALKVMEEFAGVEFRLQLIKTWKGVKIYNDSAATNPSATIQALKSLPNSILICGGVNKNLDYRELAQAINQYAKEVYFLEGDASEEIKKQIPHFARGGRSGQNPKLRGEYNNLEKLMEDLKPILKPGNIVLFSPGAASFNLFQNEFDRGRKFNQTILACLT